MSGQLSLLGAREAQDLGREFVALLSAIVERLGLKHVAAELDVSPSRLHHALNGTNSNHLPAEWVPWLLKHAIQEDALEFLAALRGLELRPMQPLSPAEELAAIKESLERELGPDLRAAVFRGARRIARKP